MWVAGPKIEGLVMTQEMKKFFQGFVGYKTKPVWRRSNCRPAGELKGGGGVWSVLWGVRRGGWWEEDGGERTVTTRTVTTTTTKSSLRFWIVCFSNWATEVGL